VSFVTLACEPSAADPASSGCAGVSPTEEYDAETSVPLDPAMSGGDAFDLAALGVARARYVRVRDRSAEGAAPSAGFDLDAIGWVNGD